MGKKTITINGRNFNDVETFFDEIDRVLTKDLDWQTGHNMNAFIDLLRGGFGVHDYEEPIRLNWIHAAISKACLGDELFNDILNYIREQEHIEFHLVD